VEPGTAPAVIGADDPSLTHSVTTTIVSPAGRTSGPRDLGESAHAAESAGLEKFTMPSS
jgi:hypothetical protein